MKRREFIGRVGSGVIGVSAISLMAAPLYGQTGQPSATSNVEMTGDSYRPVRLPPKVDAKPTMDSKQVDAFERQLSCPCPCTLDIYTCRTTDFTCGISPAVHRDVQAMVDGGHTADEIMSALRGTYGDIILLTPRKEGFNLLAWFAPFTALALGAVAIGFMLRRWRTNAAGAATGVAGVATGASASTSTSGVNATEAELAELEAALKDDRR